MLRKPNVLTLAEFFKLKGARKGPVVVYFNETQWKNLTRGAKPGKGKPPRKSLTLTLAELPSLPGGLVTFACPVECSGPIRGGEGQVRCDCYPGDLGPNEPLKELCSVRLRKDGSVVCKGKCHPGKPCSLVTSTVLTRNGTRLTTYACHCG